MRVDNTIKKGKLTEDNYYDTNSTTKKIFSYIVKGEKSKYIWKYAVPMRGLMIVGGISLLIGLIFGDMFDYPSYFWINTAIKVALSIPIAAFSGKLTYEVFEDIRNRGHWTKSMVWKYVIGEGIFGYGWICLLTVGEFISFSPFYIIVQLILWSGIGMIIGIWIRASWKIGKIKNIFLELKRDGVY